MSIAGPDYYVLHLGQTDKNLDHRQIRHIRHHDIDHPLIVADAPLWEVVQELHGTDPTQENMC